MKISNAQLMTLRRMLNGTRYQLTSDCKKGRQVRLAVGSKFFRSDINCSSLAPLMRKGLIEFRSVSRCDNGSYYEVVINSAGRDLVKATFDDGFDK